jgi:hypothetical protein
MTTDLELAASLLESCYREGTLSEESADAIAAVPRVYKEVATALGSDATDSDVRLVTILVDDSESIRTITRGIQAEEQGHDRLLAVLKRRELTQALVHTRLLNQGAYSPYRPLSNARKLSPGLLRLSPAGTPLYLQSLLTLGSVIVKTRQQEEQRRRIRTATLIITDGEDNASGDITARHVRFLVRDMMEFARNHIVAGMGIGETDFHRVFRTMGIPERFIFTAGSTAEDIETMFDAFADDLALAAGGEASFRQLLSG